MALDEVDDGRSLVGIGCHAGRVNLHTYAAECSGTEDHRVLELRHRLRDVNKDVAAFLHRVAVDNIVLTLTGTIDFAHSIQFVAAGYRLEVDKGIAQTRFAESILVTTIFVTIVAILRGGVVVVAVSAAEDVDDVACGVLYVGRCREHTGVLGRG